MKSNPCIHNGWLLLVSMSMSSSSIFRSFCRSCFNSFCRTAKRSIRKRAAKKKNWSWQIQAMNFRQCKWLERALISLSIMTTMIKKMKTTNEKSNRLTWTECIGMEEKWSERNAFCVWLTGKRYDCFHYVILYRVNACNKVAITENGKHANAYHQRRRKHWFKSTIYRSKDRWFSVIFVFLFLCTFSFPLLVRQPV